MEIKQITAASVIDVIGAIADDGLDQRCGQAIWYSGARSSISACYRGLLGALFPNQRPASP